MKRGGDHRSMSPSSKRSRSSVGRYDDSSNDEGRRRSRTGSPGRRYPPPEPLHRDRGDDYIRSSRAGPPPPSYKILCVSNLHPKAGDEMIRDALYREFKRFGDVSVKLVSDDEVERLAYVYFRTSEEAREARHSKPRILFYDRPVVVEPVYDTPRSYPPRVRSRSPMDYDRGYHPRSPMEPEMDDRYDMRYDRGRPLHPLRDYYDDPHPRHHDDYGYRPFRGRGPPGHHYGGGPPMRGGGFKHFGDRGGRGGPGGGGGMERMDRMGGGDRRDRFPNYLHHVPPEEDPLATRTLFAGNLEINISDAELSRIFARYGTVDDIDVKRPPPGTGNAYAFVRYHNLDMAHRAKLELSGQYIGKFQCKIGYGKVLPTTRCWVGGLGPWTSLTQLTQEFDRFGAIKKIEYEKGDSQAYILYETLDAAQAAVKEMRGFPLGGSDKKLRTDFADVEGEFPPPGPGGANNDEFKGDYGGGEFSGGYGRGRGRGRGWFDRGGRGGHRGGYHGDYQRSDNHGYENKPEVKSDHVGGGNLSGSRNLADVARCTGSTWQGSLILKNSSFGTKMHMIEGDPEVAEMMRGDEEAGQPVLRITQRLRLDQSRLDDVSRRISAPSMATILLSLPNSGVQPAADENAAVQARPLRNLVAYLKQKEAAGVITLTGGGKEGGPGGGVLYAFPPCAFSLELLRRVATNLTEETTRDDHLVVVVVKGAAS